MPHQELTRNRRELEDAGDEASRLMWVVWHTAAALREDPRADCHPLIVRLSETSQFLRNSSGERCLYLLSDLVSEGGFAHLLSVCIKVDAAQDAMLCFQYPTENNETLLGVLGNFLLDLIRACDQEINPLCRCCNQGTGLFLEDLQRQLLPALTRLVPQATTALNTAHDHLRTLPTPWPSESPHILLLGIAKLLNACCAWGGPRGNPKPFSSLVTALARHRALGAAISLLAALQDPTLVAHPATPTAHPLLHTTIYSTIHFTLALTSPKPYYGGSTTLATDVTLTPAARRALCTHLLSDQHFLLHLLHTAAACCHAAPASTRPIPTPALSPRVRQHCEPHLRLQLQLARAWLTGDEAPNFRLHLQPCYAASPAAVWRAVGQLLTAIAQPKGWQVAGPEVLRLVGALPIGHLAEQHPDLVLQVASPLVDLLLRWLQELQQRRRQLERGKPVILERLTGVDWEARRGQALDIVRQANQCVALLQVLAEGPSVPRAPLLTSVEAGAPEVPTAPTSTQLLTRPEVSQQLQAFLGDPALTSQGARSPARQLQHARDILQRLKASLGRLARTQLGIDAPQQQLDAWQGYFMSASMLLLTLALAGSCLRALVARKWEVWKEMATPHLLQGWRTAIEAPVALGGLTLSPGLVLLEACPSSLSDVVSGCSNTLRWHRRRGAQV